MFTHRSFIDSCELVSINFVACVTEEVFGWRLLLRRRVFVLLLRLAVFTEAAEAEVGLGRSARNSSGMHHAMQYGAIGLDLFIVCSLSLT